VSAADAGAEEEEANSDLPRLNHLMAADAKEKRLYDDMDAPKQDANNTNKKQRPKRGAAATAAVAAAAAAAAAADAKSHASADDDAAHNWSLARSTAIPSWLLAPPPPPASDTPTGDAGVVDNGLHMRATRSQRLYGITGTGTDTNTGTGVAPKKRRPRQHRRAEQDEWETWEEQEDEVGQATTRCTGDMVDVHRCGLSDVFRAWFCCVLPCVRLCVVILFSV
jgi:hypothetical protein